MPGKRLSRMFLQKTLHVIPNKHCSYTDFHSFAELTANEALMSQLVASYQAIFADPEGWAEHYTCDEILHKLKDELAGQAILRVCMSTENRIIGFCWAQVLGVPEIARTIGTIKYYQSIGTPDVVTPLLAQLGECKVIYLHDLGIDPLYRGYIPLTQLIYPVLDGLAKHTEVNTVLFWSIADTNISRLAKRALFDRILTLDEMRFYSGDLWASKTRPARHVTKQGKII